MNVLLDCSVCLSLPECEHRPLVRRMSAQGLTSEAQLRYILQWFGEFSELQREDFLPVLAASQSGKSEQLAMFLAALTCQDKPVSLFQCRIKLFNEWFPQWTDEEKERLVKGVTEMDAEFGQKLQEAMLNGVKVNGDINGGFEESSESDDHIQPIAEESPDQSIAHESGLVEIAAAS